LSFEPIDTYAILAMGFVNPPIPNYWAI